jgi:hypothetical protein
MDPRVRREALRYARLHPLERRRALAAIKEAAGGPIRNRRVLLWKDGAMLDPEAGHTVFNYWCARDEQGGWHATQIIS